MVENGHRLFLLTALNVEALEVGTWTVHISPLCLSCTWYPRCTEVYSLPVVEYSCTGPVHSLQYSTGYYVTFALSASPYSAYLHCMSLSRLSNSLHTQDIHQVPSPFHFASSVPLVPRRTQRLRLPPHRTMNLFSFASSFSPSTQFLRL